MKYSLYILLLFLLNFIEACNTSNNQQENLSVRNVTFESIFAQPDNDNMFCLLASGFFQTMSSENSDSLINSWITNHPDAIILPVHSFSPTESDNPNSQMTFIWVIDGKDTLNNYLVKQGAFPGATMKLPKLSSPLLEGLYHMELLIDTSAYHQFMEQIKAASFYARTKELGIWKNDSYEIERIEF